MDQETGERAMGIHFAGRSVRIAEVCRQDGEFSVSMLGYSRLPVESDANALLSDTVRQNIAEKIKEIFSTRGLDTSRSVIGINGQLVFGKSVPWEETEDEKEAREQIIWEAKQFLSPPLSDYSIHFFPIEGEDSIALVMAYRREIEALYEDISNRAGIVPLSVDLDPFALFNAYEAFGSIPENGSLVLVAIERYVSTALWINKGMLFSMLNIPYSSEPLGESSLSREEDLMRYGREIGNQVKVWYKELNEADLQKIVLTGAGSLTPLITGSVAIEAGCPVEVCDLLRSLKVNHLPSDDQYLLRQGAFFTVSLGLARRGLEEIE